MTSSPVVAVLGTGLLGRAVAERLRSVGYEVLAYNRTASKALPLQAQGISVVATPQLAVAQADVILLLLTDAPAIISVLLSPGCCASLRGKTIVQMGTIGSHESEALHHEIGRHGGTYCEAPVLGSLAEAKAGTLFVMVGATEEQFDRLSPLLSSLGREPRLIGPVGKAAALKLALNQLIASEMTAFAWSLGLVRRSGVSIETFMAILRQSALFAPTFDKKLPRLLKRDYKHPNFSTAHLLKDVVLCGKEAAGLGLREGVLDGLRTVLEDSNAKGLADVDYSAMYESIDPKER